MKADLIVKNIKTLLTPIDHLQLVRGKALDEIMSIDKAFIAVKDGLILDFGNHDYQQYICEDTQLIDALNQLVTPGFIDSHTHVCHAGSREHEFELKRRGVPYLEILKQGGGIISSVNATRQASFEDLYEQTKKSLELMLFHGVTTVEGKTGYGLDMDTELKQLYVMKALNEKQPVDIIPTFMGAHALPTEYIGNKQAYLDLVVNLLPQIKEENLAEFVDIFCEEGVFDVQESRYVLESAKKLGFNLKIHADEIVALGGVKLAADLNAVSADHLMAINEEGLIALRDHEVIANILPSTSFNLNKPYAPVRTMIDYNLAIALSSDYNPGSAPCENYLFTLNLAALHLKMTPNEILNAATINAAHSVNRADKLGIIKKGFQADFIIFDADNWPYILYHYAINHVRDVFKNGRHVIKNKQINWG